jgi:uncharacterized integral membrane protein
MAQLFKIIIGSVFLALIFVIGLDLHVRNHQSVALNYYGGTIEMPVSLLLATTLLCGALLGIAVTTLKMAVRSRRRREFPALDLDLGPAGNSPETRAGPAKSKDAA